MCLLLPAPAKINLFLHILGKRDDGKHNLQTAFQLTNYADRIHFDYRDDDQIIVHCNMDIDPKDNIVTRAAYALREYTHTNKGIEIRVDKNIPIGAGLGGGSSDAATTLHGLNYMWETECKDKTLVKIGLSLGADVPLFIKGRSAWGEGIGERLTPMKFPTRFFAVFVPDIQISTAEMFKNLKSFYQSEPLNPETYCIGDGINQFEEMVLQAHPQIAELMEKLQKLPKQPGNLISRLSGTGGAVFTMSDDINVVRELVKTMEGELQGFKCFVTTGLGYSHILGTVEALKKDRKMEKLKGTRSQKGR